MIIVYNYLLYFVSLKNIILEKIKYSEELLPFRDFMNMALYYPKLGYYARATEKISSKGDFITTTSQTPLFAKTFARIFSTIIPKLGNDCNIIEFGAGNGKFALDCIYELECLSTLPKNYIIIELSNYLKLKQQSYIKEKIPHLYSRFIWLNKLPEKKLKAIIFGNEILDSMPVDIFKFKNNSIIQQSVIKTGDNLKLSNMKKNDSWFQYESNFIFNNKIFYEDNYTSEINIWIRPWIRSLYKLLSEGVVFLCDYGYHRDLYYSEKRNMGTLLCYHKHKVNFNPFINIGEQDITAHVDFTTVAEAATEVGFELDGYMTQANFLSRAGIFEVFTNISKKLNTKDYLKYTNDIKKILFNHKLAEVFKIISFSSNFNLILDVFDSQNNIDYLL